MTNVSRTIPGNTNSTARTIFSRPESLNLLKVGTEIKMLFIQVFWVNCIFSKTPDFKKRLGHGLG